MIGSVKCIKYCVVPTFDFEVKCSFFGEHDEKTLGIHYVFIVYLIGLKWICLVRQDTLEYSKTLNLRGELGEISVWENHSSSSLQLITVANQVDSSMFSNFQIPRFY